MTELFLLFELKIVFFLFWASHSNSPQTSSKCLSNEQVLFHLWHFIQADKFYVRFRLKRVESDQATFGLESEINVNVVIAVVVAWIVVVLVLFLVVVVVVVVLFLVVADDDDAVTPSKNFPACTFCGRLANFLTLCKKVFLTFMPQCMLAS